MPMPSSHDGRIAALPITEIDLSQIPPAQGRFRFLTHDIKDEKQYLEIPAELPPEIIAFVPYQAMLRYGLEPPGKLEELVRPVMALFDPA